MRRTLPIVALLALTASPSLASDHTTCKRIAYIASAADLVVTEIAIHKGLAIEGNPILSNNRGRRIALKTAFTIAAIEGGAALQKSDSKFLRDAGWAMTHVMPVAWGAAATWGITIMVAF